ncbi:MAG: hypothetical protein NZ899_10550 [Thermoguttaceae bacterium]|nr:hypothetical protein [Thermoguttaceae bacterium]MDW8078155.1 hypothetical protein [Thermoguttaceae bacterium]
MLPNWAQRIEVTGFVISYVAALCLEVTRGRMRLASGQLAPIAWTTTGLILQAIYLVHRGAESAGLPLSSTQDWFLVSAWVLAGVYLYFAYHHPAVSFGWILLPLVLALIGIGWAFGDVRAFPRETAAQLWAWVHGLSLLLATVAVLVAFATGVMYLLQASRLRAKKVGTGWRFPSLEWLQKTNARIITLALILLGIGILSGFVLNLWNARQDRAVVPVSDPLIITTLVMFMWLAGCISLSWVYRPAREGRKVALMTVMTAVFLLVALILFVRGETRHGQFRQEPAQSHERLGCAPHPAIELLAGPVALACVSFGGSVFVTCAVSNNFPDGSARIERVHRVGPLSIGARGLHTRRGEVGRGGKIG